MEVIKLFGFGMMSNYGIFGFGFMFFRLIFWVIIILLAYFLIKSLNKHNQAQDVVGKSALDFAKERYARGEITKEELEEILKNLV